jgi:hypothetical protein
MGAEPPTISVFAHARENTPQQTLPLSTILEAIRTGRYAIPVTNLRAMWTSMAQGDVTPDAYRRAKSRLPAVTFGGIFAPIRSNTTLVAHSGIVTGDLDHLDNPLPLKAQLAQDPHVLFAFLSPSGWGLKVGVRVEPVTSAAAYHHAWTVLDAHYTACTGVPWDPAASALANLCFLSFDPELIWNPAAIPFPLPDWVPPRQPDPARPAADTLQGPRPHPITPATAHYASHALQTAVRLILRSAPGTKHLTRLRAARLVGGYLATGALDYATVWNALAAAAEATTDNLPNALRTLRDGLAYGQQAPLTAPQSAPPRSPSRSSRLRPLPSFNASLGRL